VEIIAHRGASYDAPENTLASLKLGFDQGADAGELDVHCTKDNGLVVLHDDNTLKVSGISNLISTVDLVTLRNLEVGQWGKWKGKGFTERIPTLEEALKLVPKNRKMIVEIKPAGDFFSVLEKAVQASELKPSQIVFITFHIVSARALKKRFPSHEVYWLHSWAKDSKGEFPKIEELISTAKTAGVDGLNLEWKFPWNKEFVSRIKGAGLKAYVWTVNDAPVARRLAEAGVDGITTDRPGWMREQLAKP
jgi:glycerophosphoryl diester phosphodiesterase